ncbi:hypothetical protein GCK72_003294 [Caenorhabditis remanei]|uniref:Uncharacterized protein n=1 Tax=Caenorhabditis remanei TaxID=31234 RepID=A0A6A5HU42_CAERE|nr:hypothetical protein GCK72_003294 [Caenorhabditis remanei]KAF1771468.1 hypothetical protein GCK72_003294 [Caenorhabditis remanei]
MELSERDNQATSPSSTDQNQKSSDTESSQIYTRCVNDDSNGSILSDWMDHLSDFEQPTDQSILNELMKSSSQFLLEKNEKGNGEMREVNSEYAFDITMY